MTDVTGIGVKTAEVLAEHRIKTPAALAKASIERITSIPGFSEARAATVIEAAKALLAGGGAASAGKAKPVSAPADADSKDKKKGKKKDKKKGKKKDKKKGKKKDKKKGKK
jgi:endonuclease III